jgi:hypothetical protein
MHTATPSPTRSTATPPTTVVALLACIVLASAHAQVAWDDLYVEPFGPNAHPLYVFGGVITFGPQPGDPWTALLRDGRLEVSNAVDASVIRYYFLEPRHVGAWAARAGAPVRASVLVGGTFGEVPGAGLVYGVDPSTHHFVALVLTGGNGYGVYVLDEQGYRVVTSGTSGAIDPGGGLGFYVGGERVFEGPLPGGVGVGIVAAGTGRFAFDDFALQAPR